MPDYTADEGNTLAIATFGSVALVSAEAGGLSAKAKEGIAGLRTISKEADWLMKAMEAAR